LIEALRITTDDSAPGYIDFPFWGRFPIVVVDYEISEAADEKGQCALTLVFKRAGVSITERAGSPSGIAASKSGMSAALETAVEDLQTAAINSFEKVLADNAEAATANLLSQGAAQIKTALLNSLGRIRAAETKLNVISSEINGISNLAAELVSAPRQLAQSLFSAAASIVAGLAEIKDSTASYLPKSNSRSSPSNTASASNDTSPKSSYPAPEANNEQNVLLQFLSASSFSLGSIPLTVRQEAAQKAVENLYRICAFTAAGSILPQLDVSFQRTEGYWKLFQKLEASIDKNDPAVYAALETTRIYVSCILSAKDLSTERKRFFNTPLPLLSLAQYLGCGEDKLRDLNRIADSFVVRGNVLYV
jgi:hypothetical protein